MFLAGLRIKLIWPKSTGEKSNKIFITCIPSVYIEETQKSWVTSWNGWKHHYKYHLQFETKDVAGWGCWLWEVTRKKRNKDREGCYAELSHCLFIYENFWRLRVFPLFLVQPLWMVIFLILHVNISYKRVTLLVFESFSCFCSFLKITSLK